MTSLRTPLQASLGFAALVGIAATTALGEGGANPASAVTIPALRFADTGDTTGGSDDWDEVCPYPDSTSPDHWYIYDPSEDEQVGIDLCPSSGYDTKLYVLDSGFNQVACNDDSCTSSGGGAFRSRLTDILLIGGTTYYIVIDGYLGDAGFYDMAITVDIPPPPCEITECDGAPEGEPCDDSGGPDTINGGCGSNPVVFGSVDCGETICSTAWALGDLRDTDWYEVNLTEASSVTMTVTAEAALNIFTLTGVSNGDCGAVGVSQDLNLQPCVEGSVTEIYDVGEAYLWVGHSEFDSLPCGQENPGNDYIMTVNCSPPPVIPCCTLGDANEDGDVGFADLIIVLDNWGECPQ